MDHPGRPRATDAPAILDALDVVVWQADARTTEFTFVSDGAAHLLGWTPEEANTGPGAFSTWLHPDDRETVLAAFLAATAGDTIDLTHRLVARDGSVRRVHTVGRLLHEPEPRLAGVMVDVTAGHEGDPDQLEAELRFRRVVERLPAIVYLETADPNGDLPGSMLYVSPQVREILGFAPEEWVNDPTAWVQHFHPDDRARVRRIYDAVSDGQGTFTAQYRMFTKEGAIRWFHDDALLIRDEQGNPMFWQGIMYDITDQRAGDALVRETEDRYRTLVEQLPAIVYSEDVTGDGLQVVYINSRVKELLGIEPEEWVADPSVWAASIHPDDAQMVDDVNRESERLSEPFSVEYRMIARDGRIVWFKDEARLVHHADGTPAYWQGVMIDITDRREAEAQVAEAEARYRALVEQMPSVTYVAALGRGGGVLYISPQIGSMLGYPPQAWYTDPGLWSRLVHPDDADRGHPEPSVGEHNVRYRMIARDGRTVWVHDQARVIVDEDGEPKYWQGVLLDVTQQHRAEDLERDLATERMVSERLREADAVKNTFLQAVSHDLRSPLAAILGLARTLERDDLDLPPAEAQDLAGRIAANARRLDRIVTDLLDLDRLSAGVVEPMFAPLDIGALVRELVAGADPVAGRRLHVDTAPLEIWADAAMVERIVENLLRNAVKHTPGDARIWVRVERADDAALLIVEDDGPGVPADTREAIFEPFSQGASPARAAGLGVGLAVVARFAALHDGRAWVEEREGGGASFRVSLAIRPSGPAPSGGDQDTGAGSASEASQA